MEDSSVPLPEPTLEQKPTGSSRRRLLRAVFPIIIVIIIIILGLLLAGPIKKKTVAPEQAHLLLDNTAKSQLVMADTSGKQLYSLSYPKFSYMHFEAVSPNGEILASRGLSTKDQSYILVVNSKAKDLPTASVEALSSAIVLNSTNQLYFTDENNVVYVDCTKTCKLMLLNLLSGDSRTIIDTGTRPLIPQLPPVYPLGLSADRQTVYVRTLLGSKLGRKTAAVYAVGLNGKVSNSWDLPAEADYTPSLSPDSQKIVYRVDDLNSKSAKISVLDIKTGKTTSAKWSNGEIVDQPGSLAWSPDSQKVVFWGSNSILPHPDQNATFDINLAYLNITDAKITNLSTVKDSAHNQIAYHGWLDSGTVIYEQDSASQANTFSSATPTIYKQNVAGGTATKFDKLPGKLLQSVYY